MFKIEDYICISREFVVSGGGVVAKSFLTLLQPHTDCSSPGCSVDGISQAKNTGVPFPSLELFLSGIRPSSPTCSRWIFYAEPQGCPEDLYSGINFINVSLVLIVQSAF